MPREEAFPITNVCSGGTIDERIYSFSSTLLADIVVLCFYNAQVSLQLFQAQVTCLTPLPPRFCSGDRIKASFLSGFLLPST